MESKKSQFVAFDRTELNVMMKIALPIIISQIGVVLMGVLDNIMVGQLGPAALGATGIVNAMFYTLNAIAFGGLAFLSPLVSKANAENDTEGKFNLWRICRLASVQFTIITMVLNVTFYLLFDYLGQKNEVNILARPFYFYIILSTFPMLFFQGVKQYSDGMSNTKIAMYITILGLLCNGLFNWMLIYGNLGMPALGVKGAAISTLISRIIMAISIYWVITQKWALRRESLLIFFDRNFWKKTFSYVYQGIPVGLQFFFEFAAFSIAAIIVGWLGLVQLAAHQIAISLSSITYMVASGLSTAGAIRIGTALGTQSKEAMLKVANAAVGITAIFMGFNTLCFILFPLFFVKIYISDPEVIPYATLLVIMAGIYQLSDGLQVIGLGLLRGLSDIKIPTIITLFAYWVVGLPLGALLAFYFDFNVKGIWIGLIVGLSISATLLLHRFYFLLRNRPIESFGV